MDMPPVKGIILAVALVAVLATLIAAMAVPMQPSDGEGYCGTGMWWELYRMAS